MENIIIAAEMEKGHLHHRAASPAARVTPENCCPFNVHGPPTDRITINNSGRIFQIPVSILACRPETLLGDPLKRRPFYDSARDEYYFSRHSGCFKTILQFYQTGVINRPDNVPLELFLREVVYFDLGRVVLLQLSLSEGLQPPTRKFPPKNSALRQIFHLLQTTQQSLAAKIFSAISTVFVLLSVVVFHMEPLPKVKNFNSLMIAQNVMSSDQIILPDYSNFVHPIFIIESVCMAWFTIEFIARFLICSKVRLFFMSILNVIDIVAIVPFFLTLGIAGVMFATGTSIESHKGYLVVQQILRFLAVFRMFKLCRYSRDLQILGEALWMSIRELAVLTLFLSVTIILLGVSVCLAENGNSEFATISDGLWWAIITLTTVGDAIPASTLGRLVGGLCAVSGLILVALPIPMIVDNFITLYQNERKMSETKKLFEKALQETCQRQPGTPTATLGKDGRHHE